MSLEQKHKQLHQVNQNTNWMKLRPEINEEEGILYNLNGKKHQFLYIDMIGDNGIFFGVVKDQYYYSALIRDNLFQQFIQEKKDIEKIIIENASGKMEISIENGNDALAVKDYFKIKGKLLLK